MRNFVRLTAVFLLLLALPACVTAPERPATVDDETCRVGIELIGKTHQLGVVVRFRLYGSTYTHIVQEITLDDGDVLVECFRDDGSFHAVYDQHQWGGRDPHFRTMTVYGANCYGVDERNGFGHLPHNGRGLYTTVGPGFNRDYQLSHKTQGYISNRASNEYIWTITVVDGIITVVIDGVQQ